ncbi:hypothetical protein JXJ21_09240 [candidate division KSB1 bacterium]|nr:hypothetical protein [candidate division KSB1 bacterium]
METRKAFDYEIKFHDLIRNEFLSISTENSVYLLEVLAENDFIVRGGWFDKHGLSPCRVGIEGTTWGVGDVFTDIAAAAGMRIKFKNGIITSPIKSVERLISLAWHQL